MDRPLYVLPFRMVVAAMAGAFVLGAVGGGTTAWIILRQVLRAGPAGERVIERVERVSDTVSEAIPAAVSRTQERLAQLLDENGKTLGHVVPVTGDGVFAGVGSPPRSSVRLRMRGADAVSASVIRVYPEAGIFFLRAALTPALVDVSEVALPLPGASVAAVTLQSAAGQGARVRILSVESQEINRRGIHDPLPALGQVAVLPEALPATFQGAPQLAADGRLSGLTFVSGGTSVLLPVGMLAPLLDDTLRHPEETVVRVLGGIRGVWEKLPDADGIVFHVTEVGTDGPFADAGLRANDRIRLLDEHPFSGTQLPLLQPLLQAARAGNEVHLTVERGRETVSLPLRPSVQ